MNCSKKSLYITFDADKEIAEKWWIVSSVAKVIVFYADPSEGMYNEQQNIFHGSEGES